MRIPERCSLSLSNCEEKLIFLLGLFSTWQIIQVAGMSVSTVLTMLLAILHIINSSFKLKLDNLSLCLLISTLLSLCCSLIADIPAGYRTQAVKSTVQWILVFLVGLTSTRHTTMRYYDFFIKGFRWSCYVQLGWCILQILGRTILKIDLNTFVFHDLLGYTGEVSQYRDGVLVCTGLHWHAANLIPILTYVFLCHHSIVLKLLCVLIVYMTKNATSMIGIALCIILDLLICSKELFINKKGVVPFRNALFGVILFTIGIAALPMLVPKFMEMVSYLGTRIYQIWNPTEGNESSAVHFSYYQLLPEILTNIPILNVLFGSGMGTSGYRFTQFNGQYPGQIWIVESDFTDMLLSRGIVGWFLHYYFIVKTACKLLKNNYTKEMLYLLVLTICGIVYNNQFLWVIILEFAMYSQVKNKNTLKNTN